MCGIVGAIAKRDVQEILLTGLQRLEYRGYDSAGLALITHDHQLARMRVEGKVKGLVDALGGNRLTGVCGIAQTRWATHGVPSEHNAHPHFSHDEIAVVHNGVIENFSELQEKLKTQGYIFTSETDTEVIPHLIHYHYTLHQNPLKAIQSAILELKGSFALGIIFKKYPQQLWAALHKSPLVIGLGTNENFFASDYLALLPVTQRFIYLTEGDIAELTTHQVDIYNDQGEKVKRPEHILNAVNDLMDKGHYEHFMAKEIFSQPEAVAATIAGRLGQTQVLPDIFGWQAEKILAQVKAVHFVACGTSYHAALVARYWIEQYAQIPCMVEIASEYRYRQPIVNPHTLFVVISQSGETADTLAALHLARTLPYIGSLTICNVAESAMVREAQLTLLTCAGREIGVASTKAFTTQLVALLLLMMTLKQRTANPPLKTAQQIEFINQIENLPERLGEILTLNDQIQKVAQLFADKQNALFLGRGILYPIALEGALKLKEISYIHAEAYPAGELKHGALALVDKDMPVVGLIAYNELTEKVMSNLQEVAARAGQLIIFADKRIDFSGLPQATVIRLPIMHEITAPILYTIPLQLLAYHVAILKGTNVDQPRNLAKSVTVE